jgi:hypothetical protein
MENLAYALAQWVHNFGAVAVTGGALAARWPVAQPRTVQRPLAWLVCVAWAVQIASGASFGAVSLQYHGQLPDLSGIARAALVVKVASAASALALSATLLRRRERWSDAALTRAWRSLAGLGALALSAAAFLRWFA